MQERYVYSAHTGRHSNTSRGICITITYNVDSVHNPNIIRQTNMINLCATHSNMYIYILLFLFSVLYYGKPIVCILCILLYKCTKTKMFYPWGKGRAIETFHNM